ncbi:MAG: YggS family pyridoxal phosphate-dependent enzyme [Crocinitomicaceae bacterium]|nr:YggS family pyridoxal phosphate-dependent enzyme [Crocinitomicaceae bacterium]
MISENLRNIQVSIPSHVTLVAVSKTKPVVALMEVYDAGQRVFGENKVQEMCEKYDVMPKDIQWHLIGHLQTNKVKYLAPFVALIHSVDSFKLLQEINKQALKNNRVIDCLLQFHIAQEETKFGLSENEASELITSNEFKLMKNVRIVGVMGMASFTEDNESVRNEFQSLKKIFTNLKNKFFSKEDCFKEISMGMSGDYLLAIEEGSTMVRVGSSIFGAR